MKIVYHYVVFLEKKKKFGLVNFVEPKFTISHTVLFVFLIVFLFLSTILIKTHSFTQKKIKKNKKLRIKKTFHPLCLG